MAWQDEMTIISRTLVNDLGATRYTDDELEQVLVVSARFVQREIPSFADLYAADAVNITLAPDPTVAPDRNEDFIDLVCLQCACLLDRHSAMGAASQAIMIQDGSSKIDLREAFKARLELIKRGWCAVYAERRDEYLTGAYGMGTVGRAIMTPIRTLAQGGDFPSFGRLGRPY